MFIPLPCGIFIPRLARWVCPCKRCLSWPYSRDVYRSYCKIFNPHLVHMCLPLQKEHFLASSLDASLIEMFIPLSSRCFTIQDIYSSLHRIFIHQFTVDFLAWQDAYSSLLTIVKQSYRIFSIRDQLINLLWFKRAICKIFIPHSSRCPAMWYVYSSMVSR